MQYRRAGVIGGTYFFTVNLHDRQSSLLLEQVELLRKSVRHVQRSHPFNIIAMVVLPEHLHAIWQLPDEDKDYSLRWSLIKSHFSRSIPKHEFINQSRKEKRERGLWQRRFWEHQIRDDIDLENHVNYIHFNPVKHCYVKSPSEWKYSSIHRYIRKGILVPNWGEYEEEKMRFGE